MSKQNRNSVIDTENRLMVARREGGWGPGWKSWRDWEAQIGSYRIITGMTTGNIVNNNTVMTIYGVRYWKYQGEQVFKKIFLLIWESERKRETLVCCSTYTFTDWFLYVPRTGIELTTLAYWDNALTNWATRPGIQGEHCVKYVII